MTDSATFILDDIDAPALRDAVSHLAHIGYRETRVCERLGLSDLTEIMWRALPIYREEKLAARDALDLAIDLFLLQGIIPAGEINQIFNRTEQDVFIRAGLLSIDEDCRALASLFPVGNHLVFSDHAWPSLPHPGRVNVPYDQVMSVGTDSRWLARAAVRRPISAALDLCTGSGIHALLAASHSRRVVAVDINPRAAHCTHFNAQVSGARNIEVAVGDLYEPVQGQFFDLITANPPFVPSPVDSIGFRDGGRSGEDVQHRIIEGLPHHLAQGGIAQIVTELGEREGESLAGRIREWLDGAAMDILILRLREHSAANYAIGHAFGDDTYDAFFNSVHDWADNLKTQGYSRIASVLLAFQWSDLASGQPWTRTEEAQPLHGSAGAEIEAMFSAERMARRHDLYRIIEHSHVRWAGPIGLMDAYVLGSELRANTQATLMGKSISFLRWLSPLEREVLVLIEKPLSLSKLFTLTQKLCLRDEDVYASVVSLLRQGLVLLD